MNGGTPASLEEYLEHNDHRVQVYIRGPQVVDKAGKQRLAKELAEGVDLYCRLIHECALARQKRGKHAPPDNWRAWDDAVQRILCARNSATACAIMPAVFNALDKWLKRMENKWFSLRDKAQDYEDEYGEEA